MTDQSRPPGPLKPITPQRLAQELARFHAERMKGELRPEALDQKFARIIQELRERRIEGTREDVKAALQPLVENGTISRGEHDRLLAQLGMS